MHCFKHFSLILLKLQALLGLTDGNMVTKRYSDTVDYMDSFTSTVMHCVVYIIKDMGQSLSFPSSCLPPKLGGKPL